MVRIILPPDVYNQWMFYVSECPGEVSAMGRVTRHGSDFLVTKIYLLEQEVGAAHTDIDAEAICRLMLDTINDTGDLLYWVHSHANMNAFWSGTDLETIKTMGRNGLCLASVFNKKGESRHAICYKTLVEYTGETDVILHDNIPYTIGNPVSEEQEEVWRQELASKVRQRTYAPYIGNNDTNNLYKYDYYCDNDYPTGNTALTQATPNNKNTPGSKDEELTEYQKSVLREGVLGFGVDVEARVIGVKYKEYVGAVKKGLNSHEYAEIERKLEEAWQRGEFDKYDYAK